MNQSTLFIKLVLSSHIDLVTLAETNHLPIRNDLGGYLPHVTLQKVLWEFFVKQDLDTKRSLRRAWYALQVMQGTEVRVVSKLSSIVAQNHHPKRKALIDAGVIDHEFHMRDVILDFDHPHDFDLAGNKKISDFNNYVFVEICDVPDRVWFNDVVSSVLLSIPEVVGWCGHHVPTAFRRTEITKRNKREKLRRLTIYRNDASPIRQREMDLLLPQFNIESEFNVGDVVWYTVISRRGNQTREYVQIHRVLASDKFLVISRANGNKFTAGIDQLMKIPEGQFREKQFKRNISKRSISVTGGRK